MLSPMKLCKIRWIGSLFLTLATRAAAEPQAGDADFPTRNGNPRHEEKVAAVKRVHTPEQDDLRQNASGLAAWRPHRQTRRRPPR